MRRIPAIALLAAAAAVPAARAETADHITLVDIGGEAGVQDIARSRGLAVGDFNGDGFFDFFVGNTGDRNTLFLSRGDATYEDATESWIEGLPAQAELTFATTSVDYDNDGDPDIWVGNGGFDGMEPDRLYRNDGGSFSDVSIASGIAGSQEEPIVTASFGGVWGDFDNDGWLDLVVTNEELSGGKILLFHNEGDGTFVEVAGPAGIAGPWPGALFGKAASWLDMNRDGWLDIFVPSHGNDDMFFLNRGDGTFLPSPPGLGPRTKSFGSAPADFNVDGFLDILVPQRLPSGMFCDAQAEAVVPRKGIATCDRVVDGEASEGGSTQVLLLSTGIGFFNIGPQAGLRVFDTMGHQVGDLNNDGLPDIFLGNGGPACGTRNTLYVNQFDGTNLVFDDLTHLIDQPADPENPDPDNRYPYRTHGTAFVDIDHDGDLDLYVVNGGPSFLPQKEPNNLFRNDGGNQKGWLTVDLVGSISNRDGIGAVVGVRSSGPGGDRLRTYVLQGGSGFNANNPLEIHAGLWDDEQVDLVRVLWPSGVLQEFSNAPPGARMVVREADAVEDVSRASLRAKAGDWSWSGRDLRQDRAGGDALAVLEGASPGRPALALRVRSEELNGDGCVGFGLGAGPRGEGPFARLCGGRAELGWRTPDGRMRSRASGALLRPLEAGRALMVRLHRDGGELALTVDGKELARVPARPAAGDGVALWTRNASASFLGVSPH